MEGEQKFYKEITAETKNFLLKRPDVYFPEKEEEFAEQSFLINLGQRDYYFGNDKGIAPAKQIPALF